MQESDVAERLPRQMLKKKKNSTFFCILGSEFFIFIFIFKSDIGNSKGNGPQMALPLPESHVMHKQAKLKLVLGDLKLYN